MKREETHRKEKSGRERGFHHRLLVQGKDDRCTFPRDLRQNAKLESLPEYRDLTSIHVANLLSLHSLLSSVLFLKPSISRLPYRYKDN